MKSDLMTFRAVMSRTADTITVFFLFLPAFGCAAGLAARYVQ